MSIIHFTFTGQSGLPYSATIERMSDSYFRRNDSEVFQSGLAFITKSIALAEGLSENLGSYSVLATGDSWQDGLYKYRVHHTGRSVHSTLFGVKNGSEVSVGEASPAFDVYHADIQFIRASGLDKYSVNWFKNGVKQYGVTSPSLRVLKRSDGSFLVIDSALTQIGSTGAYKLDVSVSANQQEAGEIYEVMASGIINSSWRPYSWILGRDENEE